MAADRSALAAAAEVLLAAHHRPAPLVLPNVWDVASARAVVAAGFPVIATSSRAIGGVLGLPDDDTSDPDDIFAFLARISAAVDGPLTADLEGGYRLEPAELVDRMLAAGIVGCNLEDTDHHGDGVLIDPERQAAFLGGVRAASEAAGVHVVINARIDTFIRATGDPRHQLDDAVQRGRLYLAAGADCAYPIMLADRETIRTVTEALPGPVNVMAHLGGLGIADLAGLGVKRISFGSGLHDLAIERFRAAVTDLASGTTTRR